MGLDIGTSHIVAGKSFESRLSIRAPAQRLCDHPVHQNGAGPIEQRAYSARGARRGDSHFRKRRRAVRGTVPRGGAPADDGRPAERERGGRYAGDPAAHYALAGPRPQAGADALFQRAGAGVWRAQRQIHISTRPLCGSCCVSWAMSPRASARAWPWYTARWAIPTSPASASVAAAACATSAWRIFQFR